MTNTIDHPQKNPPDSSEIVMLTVDKIREQFKDEWVLLANVVTDDNEDIQKGRVIWHSKKEEEIELKAQFTSIENRKLESFLFMDWLSAADQKLLTFKQLAIRAK